MSNKRKKIKRKIKTAARSRSKKQGKGARMKPACNAKYGAVLEEANALLDNGKNEEAALQADSLLTGEVRESDQIAFLFASRIKGFAFAALSRHDKVVQIAQEALAVKPDLLDFCYLLSYSYLKLEEFELAETYARKFIEICTQYPQDHAANSIMPEMPSKLFMIHNYLGVALKAQERLQEASREFKESYRLNPAYPPAYINHAQLLHGQNDNQAARAVLKQAIRAGVDIPEIRMLAKSYEEKPGLSVCMIVKNEEKFLGQCLDSIKDLADELIIVDTGSNDGTVDIAKRHGAKVYFHKWENDFSKARNYSLSYATNEWIFIIDADEELMTEDIPILKEVMRQKDYNMISVNVYNLGPEGSLVSSFLPSIRMFRRSTGAKYEGIVHNQLKFDEKNEKVLRVNARIKHYGYGLDPQSMKRKVDRSKKLLLKQVEENPDNFFAHFNLAQLYRGESPNPSPDVCEMIIRHADYVITHTDPYKPGQRHLHLMSLHQMVSANFFLGEYDKAIEYCKKALEYKPDFLDPIISLGHIYCRKSDLPAAREWYLKYLEESDQYDESKETDQIILLNLKSKHLAYCGLGYISDIEQKFDEALEWYRRCLEESPDYLDLHFRIGTILFNKKQYREALQELELELRVNTGNWAAYYTLGETHRCLENSPQAEKAYLTAHSLKQDNADILYSLAGLYTDTNRPREALKYAQKILEIDPNFVGAYRIMGDIHFQLSQYNEACQAYTNFIIRNASDIEVWNNLGNSHFKLGQLEQARQCYERVIEIDSSYGLAYRNLAICLGRMGRFEESADILKGCLRLIPDDIDLIVMAAEICINLKRFEEAITYLEKAISINPNSPQLLTLLGDCYARGGYLESARMGYHQALKIDPDFKSAAEKLAQIDEIAAAKK